MAILHFGGGLKGGYFALFVGGLTQKCSLGTLNMTKCHSTWSTCSNQSTSTGAIFNLVLVRQRQVLKGVSRGNFLVKSAFFGKIGVLGRLSDKIGIFG